MLGPGAPEGLYRLDIGACASPRTPPGCGASGSWSTGSSTPSSGWWSARDRECHRARHPDHLRYLWIPALSTVKVDGYQGSGGALLTKSLGFTRLWMEYLGVVPDPQTGPPPVKHDGGRVMLAATIAAVALTITTQNVRVGLPPPAVHHDIDQAAVHSSVVLTQEMGKRRAAQVRPSRLGHLAPPPGSGRATARPTGTGTCGTDRATSVRPITWASFRAGHRFAQVTTLRGRGTTLAVVWVHSITRSLERTGTFNRGMVRLGRVLHRLEQRNEHVVVGGDWNRVYPSGTGSPGSPRSHPARPTGPRGGRVDYLYWHHARHTGDRVITGTRSDHNGFRVHLRLT